MQIIKNTLDRLVIAMESIILKAGKVIIIIESIKYNEMENNTGKVGS